jgi:hypothetical protein
MAVVISRGNAVPVVKKLSGRMGTEFPLLLYGRMHGNNNSSQFKYIIIMYLKFEHVKHETGCA